MTGGSSWGAHVTLSGGRTTQYIDSTGLSAGSTYEYEVKKIFSGGDTGYSYASVSLGAAAVHSRGKVILIVDNTLASNLATQLADLTSDLIGDGWAVVRHDVDRDDPNDRAARVAAVKAVIQAEYNADSSIKAVVLIGHIPVPYSGVFDVDGHTETRGVYPADVYYGDVVDGNLWTDDIYGNTLPAWDQNNNSIDDRKDNFYNDGKFDQDRIPSSVELAVGRIDFADLCGVNHAFTGKTEEDLLQQYFDKNHKYRHKIITLTPSALLADLKAGGYWSEWAPLATGWGRFSGLVKGSANIYFHDTSENFITHLVNNQRYITQIAGTSGSYSGIDNGSPAYTSSQFAANDIKTFFIAIGASHISDWDSTDNFLRSALGSATYTVCAMTADNPSFTFHLLNTGATWGEVLRTSQNNKGFPVRIASNQALPPCTYSVGTTITLTANANGALASTSIDSGATGANAYTLAQYNRVLVKNQATSSQNGIYYVADLGDATKPWKL